jgi:hypothetical protein
MGLIAKDSGGGDFTPPPAGSHISVCVQVIDLGHQYSKYYDKWGHKVLIGWELVDEKDAEGKPFVAMKRYTVSLHENAALRGHLESWRGRAFTEAELAGFDIKKILGQPCMLSITHRKEDNKTYADVNSVMALPKGTAKPTATMPQVHFDLDAWDDNIFKSLSEGIQKTINFNRPPPRP